MYKKDFISVGLLLLISLSSPLTQALNQQYVMGSGSSTPVTTLFFDLFNQTAAKHGTVFSVEKKSRKHAGGIKASDDYLFGRTGRPLSKAEKGNTKEEIVIARIPLTFVAGRAAGVKDITIGDLSRIYSRSITNWKQLGGADHNIELVGREPTESAFMSIKNSQYFMRNAQFDRILKNDDAVIDYIQSPEGDYALSFGTRSTFDYQYLLNVRGFNVTLDVGLVYDRKNKDHILIDEVRKYVKSRQWQDMVIKSDYLPPRGAPLEF